VSNTQQGELQGALSSLHAIGMIAAPFVYTWTFAMFTGAGAIIDLPGAVFAIPAVLNVASLTLLLRGSKRRTEHGTGHETPKRSLP